jgi:DNA-binding MarR family transcriptional regulator
MALERITGHLLRRSQQVHNLLWAEHLDGELTSPQYGVLAVLAAWPRIDQQQVGNMASLDKSSVADIVARLVAGMWIMRTRDTRDARHYVLQLSPASSIALAHLNPAVRRVQEILLEPLPAARRTDFVSQLQRVARLDPAQVRTSRESNVLNLDAPGHLIRRAQRMHTAIWLEELGRDITGPQYATMHVASSQPGISQKRLGDLAGLDKSTAADIVRRLVQRGWLMQERDPDDGRGRLLRVSPAADDVVIRLAPDVRRVQARLLEPLTPAERGDFIGSLSRVAFGGAAPGAVV